MEIRRAQMADLPRIMEILAYARQFMAEHGNPRQWAERNWPPEDVIQEDIAAEKSYVCVSEGTIIGTFFYDEGEHVEPSYDHIYDGTWIGEEHYGVVHRIATDGSTRGTGSFCLNWAFGQCGHLRIDTHPDNYVMQNMLQKLGFRKCGSIHVVEDGDPRYAYEKLK